MALSVIRWNRKYARCGKFNRCMSDHRRTDSTGFSYLLRPSLLRVYFSFIAVSRKSKTRVLPEFYGEFMSDRILTRSTRSNYPVSATFPGNLTLITGRLPTRYATYYRHNFHIEARIRELSISHESRLTSQPTRY